MPLEIDQLIRRHKDAVYRQLFRMCGNHEDAEDVLSESMIKAFRALDQLEDPTQFQGWLVQIGRRTCGRLKRREALRPFVEWTEAVDRAAGSTETEEVILESELKECLVRAFDDLPARYQDVYRLRDLEGRSAEEVASSLGLTVANVKSRLHRARQRVRARVEAHLAGPESAEHLEGG